MTFLDQAFQAAIEAFIKEIEPEIKNFHDQLNAIRQEFLDVSKELAELIELFKRHLVASRIYDDEVRERLFALEKQSPKTEPVSDENSLSESQ